MNKKKVKIISILIAIVIIIFGGVYVADLFLVYEAPEIKKLSEYIYRKYSSDGTDIDSKQWETILKEYNPYKSESKKM